MKSIIQQLGKVSITVEKDYHTLKKEYDKLVIVEEAGTFTTYISRKPVPFNVPLNDREYWIPFSSINKTDIPIITANEMDTVLEGDPAIYLVDSNGNIILDNKGNPIELI